MYVAYVRCIYIHMSVAYVRAHLIYFQKHFYNLKLSHPASSFASPSVWIDFSQFVKSLESINNQYIILKCRLKTELFSLVMTSCTTSCRVSEG